MGQKVNPSGLRLGINRTWDSRWYSDEYYSIFLENDFGVLRYSRITFFLNVISLKALEHDPQKSENK